MHSRICTATFCALLGLGSLAPAQQAGSGAYPFATFDSKVFDSVNLGNLNTHFSIPVFTKQGRGLPFTYQLVYDGLVWTPTSASGSAAWTPDAQWGFRGQLGDGQVGYVTYSKVADQQDCGYNPTKPTGGTYYSNYRYHDSYGQSHSFNYSVIRCVGGAPSTTIAGDGSSSDGSGYTFDGNNVHTRNGGTLYIPAYANALSGVVLSGSESDPYGNSISFDGNGNFTDTTNTGSSHALVLAGTGTPTSPITLTYPVVNQANAATTAAVTVSYKAYSVKTAFSCSGVTEYTATSVNLVDRVTLPGTGGYFALTYEATPGVSGSVTGRLASLTLPSGGVVSYSYSGGGGGAGGSCSGINPDGTPATLTRRTTDGAKVYARSINSNLSTTAITDEGGNGSQFTFENSKLNPGNWYETERFIYSGSVASGTLLYDRATYYNTQTAFAQLTAGITQTDVYEVYNGQNAKGGTEQLRTTNTYNAAGLLTASTTKDTTAGTVEVTGVSNSYDSSNRLTSTQQTLSPSATFVSETDYGYTGSQTATSGLPQHTATGYQSAPTSTSVWTTTSAASAKNLTTTLVYDDAGQVLSSTAPNGGKTSFHYDSTDTFITQTTYPQGNQGIALVTSASYDVPSGALISSTGTNTAQTTNITQYDALLRPTTVMLPISGAQTALSYSPTQSTTTSPMSSNTSTSTTAVLDAYGRQVRSYTSNGSAYYLTDTCYNAVGLVAAVSVPYASGSTTGSSQCTTGDQSTYDGLGRITLLTHLDGSASAWAYTNRAVKQTDTPGTTKVTQYDLVGRVASVCEVSGGNAKPDGVSPGPCGPLRLRLGLAALDWQRVSKGVNALNPPPMGSV